MRWGLFNFFRLCLPSYPSALAKRGNIVARRADTRNVSECFKINIFCVQNTKFVAATNVARVAKRVNIWRHHHVSAMLQSQCVLVLPAPYCANILSPNCRFSNNDGYFTKRRSSSNVCGTEDKIAGRRYILCSAHLNRLSG